MTTSKWKYLFDPNTAQFVFLKIPVTTSPTGSGTVVQLAGELVIPTGTTFQIFGTLELLAGATLIIENNGTLLLA